MEWLQNSASNDDDTWISASDMMAGLMMIFLFIAIIYIQNIGKYFDAVSDVRDDICKDLKDEFSAEVSKWDMTICESGLLIRFESDSNFQKNSSELSLEFQNILTEFMPRLLGVIWDYKEVISELRIEGHTDSSTRRYDTVLTGYLYNTKLSQDRSRNVMSYALNLPEVIHNEDYLEWSFHNLTAHGLSSSEPILESGKENYDRSRRVEFRLRTRAEDELLDLVAEISGNGS